MPVIHPPVERNEADPAAGAAVHHCRYALVAVAGRIIVGIFERAAAPRAPLSPDTWVRALAMP